MLRYPNPFSASGTSVWRISSDRGNRYSEYFKQNLHMIDALDFLAELAQRIPPKRLQGAVERNAVGKPSSDGGEEVNVNARKRAWARLLAKVYEVNLMVCPKCVVFSGI